MMSPAMHVPPVLSGRVLTCTVPVQKFDVVTATYALSEVPTDHDRERIVEQLWQRVAPGGLLVLVDSGNGWGFHCIQVCRASRCGCIARTPMLADRPPWVPVCADGT